MFYVLIHDQSDDYKINYDGSMNSWPANEVPDAFQVTTWRGRKLHSTLNKKNVRSNTLNWSFLDYGTREECTSKHVLNFSLNEEKTFPENICRLWYQKLYSLFFYRINWWARSFVFELQFSNIKAWRAFMLLLWTKLSQNQQSWANKRAKLSQNQQTRFWYFNHVIIRNTSFDTS